MRLPVRLVYVEEQPDKVSAIKRELAIKRLGRNGKRKLVEGSIQVYK
jgi:predicted GIY-YIG superfamily endonuclease